MHVHFPELVDGLLVRLAQMPVPFDLLVTNSSGSHIEIDASRLPRLQHLAVYDVENHGRDILPLVRLINDGLLNPYELVLKIHTKKSAWRESHDTLDGSGEAWRDELLSALLPDEAGIKHILSAFAGDLTLGVLTAEGSLAGAEHWGGDRDIVEHLLARIQMRRDETSLRFAAGSMYWSRGFLLQGLRSLDLDPMDFETEDGQIDGTTAHGVERVLGILTEEAGYRTRDTGSLAVDDPESWTRYSSFDGREPRARAVPFYLPQFHAFPENDRWWGAGFTEWSNVAAARPVFQGHVQPFLPGELGFYDLTKPDIRDRQYDLATAHGIEGFMYYYYWFSGKRLMDGPIEALHAGDRAQPFCIMWANENWTRTWDGGASNVLLGQNYDDAPAEDFIDDVMHLIADPRYIRVNGRPLIAVYKLAQFPDPAATLASWRQRAITAGIGELHIVAVDVGRGMDGVGGDPSEIGFDAYLEFAPHNIPWTGEDTALLGTDERMTGRIMDYRALVDRAVSRLYELDYTDRYPGVMVNFDNTARRQWNPDLWYGSNPYRFRRWLAEAVAAVATRPRDERIVFINAWNEWAEGAVLEPSQRFGRTYLLAARDVLIG
nr:glycoside hydrolase family 99-like domain-containing protein [Salinibacterium sp. ZJ77]